MNYICNTAEEKVKAKHKCDEKRRPSYLRAGNYFRLYLDTY